MFCEEHEGLSRPQFGGRCNLAFQVLERKTAVPSTIHESREPWDSVGIPLWGKDIIFGNGEGLVIAGKIASPHVWGPY